MCFPKFINHLSQTNYTNCIARLQRQKKVEHPGNHFRFVKMKKAPKPYGFSAFCWSEWRDLNSRPLDPQLPMMRCIIVWQPKKELSKAR